MSRKVPRPRRELAKTDRNGRVAALAAPLVNWANDRKNRVTRSAMEKAFGIDREAVLPSFHGRTFVMCSKASAPPINRAAPAAGRKAILYATCFVNCNNPSIGEATRAVLARNGVETQAVYIRCCGMPQLEQGDLATVARSASEVAVALGPRIDKGYDVIALVPSCALMLKFEWPLILPNDPAGAKLSSATFGIREYVVDIARKEGLTPGLSPLGGGVTIHLACHARAQNVGQKAAEMLRLLPGAEVAVIERCSGHGGLWGVLKGNFDTAVKVGRPGVAERQSISFLRMSACPNAILQGMELAAKGEALPRRPMHPIELVARAYGLPGGMVRSGSKDAMTSTAPRHTRRLTREDILPLAEYAAVRRQQRSRIAEVKRQRRLEVGPFATFHFENYDTMRQQVEEMLYIEKGGDVQLENELSVYNPLIPQGSELIATIMFEIDDPVRRSSVLGRLGGIENRAFLAVADERIRGCPDSTRENTSAQGKASAVQFVKFPFAESQINRFKSRATQVVVGFDHHMAVMPERVHAALSEDFD